MNVFTLKFQTKEPPNYADIILYNANIITMDPSYPKASLVAIKNNRIIAISESLYLHDLIKKNTELIDCKGKTVLPGFIDSHFHLLSLAERLLVLNLEPSIEVRSISDILSKIKTLAQNLPKGEWIRGKGYNEFYLEEKRHPNRWELDKVSPYHPVKLTHRSGNAHVLNSLALRIVGITKETPDPPDGLIERDLNTGEPTGVLYHMGKFLADKVPHLDEKKLELGVSEVNKELLSLGITSIQDLSPFNTINKWQTFKKIKYNNLFLPRLSIFLSLEELKEFDHKLIESDPQVGIKGYKIILDKTTGRILPERKELFEIVSEIHKRGFQVAFHAIEEEEIETACSAIEYAIKRYPHFKYRHRIEHCSVCPPSLAKRIASLGITVVSHPQFIYYNGERYLKTVPIEKIKYLYPFSSMIKRGIKLIGSSDAPLAPPNPLIGIYAAITRKTSTGESLLPEESITPLEGLRIYTQSASWICFEEKNLGSITPGKLADLVILSNNPTKVTFEDIKDIKVEMTILDGKIVWISDKF